MAKKLPRLEHEDGVLLLDDVRRHAPGAGLQTTVGQVLEPEPGAVVSRGLLGVADPPLDVVEVQELALLWFGSLLIKVYLCGYLMWVNSIKLILEKMKKNLPFPVAELKQPKWTTFKRNWQFLNVNIVAFKFVRS